MAADRGGLVILTRWLPPLERPGVNRTSHMVGGTRFLIYGHVPARYTRRFLEVSRGFLMWKMAREFDHVIVRREAVLAPELPHLYRRHKTCTGGMRVVEVVT